MSYFQAPISYLKKNAHSISVIAVSVMGICFSFSFALFNIGLVTTGICLAIDILDKKKFFYSHKVLFLLSVAYMATAFFSLTQTQYFHESIGGISKLFRYLMVFILAREVIRTERNLRLIVLMAILGGVVASLDGLYQYAVGTDLLRGRTPNVAFGNVIRISSSFPNTNALVIYLGFIIPLTYACVVYGKLYRFWGWVVMGILLAVLGLTYSRTGFLSIGAAALFFVIMKRDWKILLIAIFSMMLLFFLLPENIRSWIAELDSWSAFFVDESRKMHHATAWNMFKHSPFFGVGINTFDINYSDFKLANDPTTRWSAHHAYLQMLAETGAAGFTAFLTLVGGIFYQWRKAYSACANRQLKAVLLGFAGSLVTFFVACFFESCLWQPRQTYYFWAFSGIMCSAVYYVLKTSDER